MSAVHLHELWLWHSCSTALFTHERMIVCGDLSDRQRGPKWHTINSISHRQRGPEWHISDRRIGSGPSVEPRCSGPPPAAPTGRRLSAGTPRRRPSYLCAGRETVVSGTTSQAVGQQRTVAAQQNAQPSPSMCLSRVCGGVPLQPVGQQRTAAAQQSSAQPSPSMCLSGCLSGWGERGRGTREHRAQERRGRRRAG